jgi:hypothetical protein
LSSAPIKITIVSQIQNMNAMRAPRGAVSLVVAAKIFRVPRK